MKPLSRLLLVIAVMTLTLSGPLTAAHAAPATFSDDFNSGPLNTSAWKTVLPWGTQYNSNHEQEWYNPGNLSFTNGGLRISTLQQSMNGYPYTSGVLTSQSRYSYGYYEFRAKLPKGQGVWPALWLLCDGTHEIDVMEMLGNDPTTIYMTYHRSGSQVYQARYTGPDFSAGYHTFAVDWQPSYIRWYIDGVKRGEYTGTILSTAQNIVMNTAVGGTGSWPGTPNSSTVFPQYMDVDYIHVYPTMADATTATTPPAPPAPPANTAPVGYTDSYSTNQDTALAVAAPGVLANDKDAENNLLTASLVGQPAHGTLAFNADGSFIYTPAPGYVGSDSFSYQASDGSLKSAVTTVNLTVKAVNHPPVASADSYATTQGVAVTVPAPGVLANDSDPDGNALTAVIASQPSHGTVSLSANGSFVYTPAAGWSGADSFTYKASDGSLSSAAAQVSIQVAPAPVTPPSDPGTTPVNPPAPPAPPVPPVQPVVANNDAYSTNQDAALTVAAPGVLKNDSGAATASVVVQPANGRLTFGSDGSFTYVPNTGFVGTDSFTYRASNATTVSAPANVTITVKRVHAPHGRSHNRPRLAFSATTFVQGVVRSVSTGWSHAWGYAKRFLR